MYIGALSWDQTHALKTLCGQNQLWLHAMLYTNAYMYIEHSHTVRQLKLYSKHAGHNDSSPKESLRCFKCSRPFSVISIRLFREWKNAEPHGKGTWQHSRNYYACASRTSDQKWSLEVNCFVQALTIVLLRIFACTKKYPSEENYNIHVRKYSWASIIRTPGVLTSSGWLKYSDTRMTHYEPRPSILLHVKVTNDVQSSYKCTSLAHNA